MFKTRFVVVRDAITVLLRHLGSLPRSDETEELRARIQDCTREVEQWSALPPTARDHDVLVRRLLTLHVEVKKLECDAPRASVRGLVRHPSNSSAT
jgi:hypothetical protein